jgi:L-methionine (R)-S-oxide reductase
MPEGIDLPAVARGTLLPLSVRLERLDRALPQMRAALAGETDRVALEATVACLLFETFVQASWCGFYRKTGPELLTVGPYQGPMGCLRIDFARGVCGAAARTREVQLVPDVEKFPGHIACDSATKSELVVPVVLGDELISVLDLDSRSPEAFSREEADRLTAFLQGVFC